MKVKQLDAQTSVSDQLVVEDVAILAEKGIACIVCNRPDNEGAGQESFEEIAEAAKALNIHAVNIPFIGGHIAPEQTKELMGLLSTYENLHAYCRTGNRSTALWASAQAELGASVDEILKIANTAGYDVSRTLHAHKVIGSAPTVLAKPVYDVVIVGAGSGGIATAASLLKRQRTLRIALVDPVENHFYRPGWTMVGAGVFDLETTHRKTKALIPRNATWIKTAVTNFDPNDNCVELDNGKTLYYKHLVVAAGLTLNWGAIEGLTKTLGKNGVTSNYRYELAPYTWQLVSQFKAGKAIFTQPHMPIKCAGAPQKALYLSADHWFKAGFINEISIEFYSASNVLFNIAAYIPALQRYIDKYRAKIHYTHELVKIDGDQKKAWFSTKDTQGQDSIVCTSFDMIHVCPPQIPPTFISNSILADNAGWLDVHPDSLQHKSYDNVWGVGDVINTSNIKTMAAARKQAPIVAQNIVDSINFKEHSVAYNGYSSCPLTVERGKVVLAEFGYGGELLPTFPKWLIDGKKPARFSWILNSKLLPMVYWHGMLKGREWLAKPQKIKKIKA
jgi:sulfide:quinone oxidoreductase